MAPLLVAAVGPLARAVRNPFALVLLLVAVAWFVVEFRQSIGRRFDAPTQDQGSGLFINAATVGGAAVAIVISRTLPVAAIHPYVLAAAAGSIFLGSGIALRLWSFRTLGRYFTFQVQTSPDQPVITTGPYRLVRHPSYTGVLLAIVGVGFLIANWVSIAVIVVVMTGALAYRIRVEERALTEALGEAYRAYASTHKRLVPYVW